MKNKNFVLYAPVISKSILDLQREVNFYNSAYIDRLTAFIAEEEAERRQRVLAYEGVWLWK